MSGSGITINFNASFDENLKSAGVSGGEATIIGDLNRMVLRSGFSYPTVPGTMKGGNGYMDLAKATFIGIVSQMKEAAVKGATAATDPLKKVGKAALKVGTGATLLYATHLSFQGSLCAPSTAALAAAFQSLPVAAGQHAACSAASASYQTAMAAAALIVTPTLGRSALKDLASIFISQETIDAVEAKITEVLEPKKKGGRRPVKKTRKASRKSRKHTRRD